MEKALLAESGSKALAWWDHDANDERTLATVSVRATREANWRCPDCDHHFPAKVLAMAERPSCPICSARAAAKRQEEYELLKVTPVADVPELMSAWADEADPRFVMVGDWGQYRFRCPQGHHPRLSVYRFHSAGCPHCMAAATRAKPQWLADVLPELAEQWHPTRNGKYTPHNHPAQRALGLHPGGVVARGLLRPRVARHGARSGQVPAAPLPAMSNDPRIAGLV